MKLFGICSRTPLLNTLAMCSQEFSIDEGSTRYEESVRALATHAWADRKCGIMGTGGVSRTVSSGFQRASKPFVSDYKVGQSLLCITWTSFSVGYQLWRPRRLRRGSQSGVKLISYPFLIPQGCQL